MTIRKPIVGKKFSRLTVEEEFVADKGYTVKAKCLCDCGNSIVVIKQNLTRGFTKSCGCLNKELAKQRETTHGMSNTREYGIWRGLINRCHNKNVASYRYYGGAGLYVCDRWRYSFENFYADMGACPPGFSIERLSNDNGYTPNNCVWADKTRQSRNRRVTKWLTFHGETLPLSAWAEKAGIKERTLHARIIDRGWSVEAALTTPVKGVPTNLHTVTSSAQSRNGKHSTRNA